MKNLDKLQINSDKLIKNEELVLIKGGLLVNGWCGTCEVTCPEDYFSGPACDVDQQVAQVVCDLTYGNYGTGCSCNCY